MVAPMGPSGLCSRVARLWMHCLSLATAGSPHCSLKLAVALCLRKRSRGGILLDLMYSWSCKTKLGEVREGDAPPAQSHTHTHTLLSPVICHLAAELNQYGSHCCF